MVKYGDLMNDRIISLKRELKKLNLDSFLVSNFYNVYYLSGFKSLTLNERESWLLITKDESYLFTDGRYIEKNKKLRLKTQNLPLKEKIIPKLISTEKNLIQHLKEVIKERKIITLGFEAEDLKFFEYQEIKKKTSLMPSFQFIPVLKLITKLRETKDQDEIKKIKKACQITDQCLKEITKTIKIGQTEKEIVFKIEFWLKKNNYELAFNPIVAINQNSSLPHYDTNANGQRKINKNSLILIDFGVKYQNYLSDITRIFYFGKPNNQLLNIYYTLLKTQQKTVNQLQKTNDAKMIDNFCRTHMKENGILSLKIKEDYNYPHSTGHGIGLEVHEFPKISINSTDTIKKNQIFTIEPGIYLPGNFGLRIEDVVWMKEDRQPKVLTNYQKKLITLN